MFLYLHSAVLPYCCTAVLLYCRIAVLLYCCAPGDNFHWEWVQSVQSDALTCLPAQMRQFAAVLLRKRLVKIWKRLPDTDQTR